MADLCWKELKAGDILLEGSADSLHALIWVGGESPFVHSAPSPSTPGVFRQKTRGYYQGDRDGPVSEGTQVFRCKVAAIAAQAAQIANRVAIDSGDVRYIAAKKRYAAGAGATRALTPYRHDHSSWENARNWDAQARMEALRAYSRVSSFSRHSGDGTPFCLSLKEGTGVDCVQFVVLVYQAACIAHKAQQDRRLKLAIDHAFEGGQIFKREPGLRRDRSSENRLVELIPLVELAVLEDLRLNSARLDPEFFELVLGRELSFTCLMG